MMVTSISDDAVYDSPILVMHGFGTSLRVWDRQLTIEDGIGRNRRTIQIPKANRTLKRIVITSLDGYMTFDAEQWCYEHGIAITRISPDAEIISHRYSTNGKQNPNILIAQVRAIDTPRALEIAKEINIRKLHGQARNLETLFSDYNSSAQVFKYAKAMDKAPSVASLMGIEGRAANTYFAPWESRVVPQWDSKSLDRIPSNWLAFAGRNSPIRSGSGHRVATDPISAMLNYGYALGYAEARAACIATGLDPRIGFLHHGKSVNLAKRDSLALDILETIRPTIDAYVVGLVRSRIFSYRNFCEPYGYDPGTCRIVAPLTHEIAEQSVTWSEVALETAQLIVETLLAK